MPKIFISHSSLDFEIVEKLTDFFRWIYNYDEEFVFCSSINSIDAGENSEECILNAIKSSSFNFFIISEQFLLSPYCMCELGAAWIQNKKPYILLVGIDRTDDRLRALPPSLFAAQHVAVREGDERLIRRWLNNVIEQINETIVTTSKGSNDQDDMRKLVKYLSDAPGSISNFSLANAFCFHDPANVSVEAMKIIEATAKSVCVSANYVDFKPNYTGLCVNLHNSSWVKAYDKGKALSFDIIGYAELPCIGMELKGNLKNIILRKDLIINNSSQHFSIKLSEQDIPRREFEQMTEIVFLLRPDITSGQGTIQISNLCLE